VAISTTHGLVRLVALSLYTSADFVDWKSNLAGDFLFMPDFDETKGYYDADGGWW
jgi:hypothetical protein